MPQDLYIKQIVAVQLTIYTSAVDQSIFKLQRTPVVESETPAMRETTRNQSIILDEGQLPATNDILAQWPV